MYTSREHSSFSFPLSNYITYNFLIQISKVSCFDFKHLQPKYFYVKCFFKLLIIKGPTGLLFIRTVWRHLCYKLFICDYQTTSWCIHYCAGLLCESKAVKRFVKLLNRKKYYLYLWSPQWKLSDFDFIPKPKSWFLYLKNCPLSASVISNQINISLE